MSIYTAGQIKLDNDGSLVDSIIGNNGLTLNASTSNKTIKFGNNITSFNVSNVSTFTLGNSPTINTTTGGLTLNAGNAAQTLNIGTNLTTINAPNVSSMKLGVSPSLLTTSGGLTLNAGNALQTLSIGSNFEKMNMSSTDLYIASPTFTENNNKWNTTIDQSINNQNGLTWVQTTNTTISTDDGAMSKNGQYITFVGFSTNIQTSNDYGKTFTARTGLTAWNRVDISYTGQYQIARRSGIPSIYTSTDFGTTWNSVSDANFSTNIRNVAISGTGKYMYVASDNPGGGIFGVFRSSDFGSSWTQSYNGSATILYLTTSSSGKYVTIVTNANTVLYSSNYGQTFNTSSIPSVNSLFSVKMSASGKYQVIAGDPCIVSSDYGQTFVNSGITSTACLRCGISLNGQYQIIASNIGEVFLSSNFGSSFSLVYNDNTQSFYACGISGNGNYMYASGDFGFVFTSSNPSAITNYEAIESSGTLQVLDKSYFVDEVYMARNLEVSDNLTVLGAFSANNLNADTLTITNDTTGNVNYNLTFVNGSSGKLPVYVANSEISYNPSTNLFTTPNTSTNSITSATNLTLNSNTGSSSLVLGSNISAISGASTTTLTLGTSPTIATTTGGLTLNAGNAAQTLTIGANITSISGASTTTLTLGTSPTIRSTTGNLTLNAGNASQNLVIGANITNILATSTSTLTLGGASTILSNSGPLTLDSNGANQSIRFGTSIINTEYLSTAATGNNIFSGTLLTITKTNTITTNYGGCNKFMPTGALRTLGTNTLTTIISFPTVTATSYGITVHVVAKNTGTVDSAYFIIRGLVTNNGGTLTLVDQFKEQFKTTNATNTDSLIVISGTNILIQVAGITGQNYQWVAYGNIVSSVY